MKIGFLQFNIAFKNPEANRRVVEEQLTRKVFDLIVLPEFFTTGYLLGDLSDAIPLAESVPSGPTVKLLESISQSTGGYIIGSLLENDGGIVYNTAVVIGPNGYEGKQRKLNPTDYEKRFCTPGDCVDVFLIKGVKVGVAICFDLWFSELSGYFFRNGVQVLCHTANYGGIQSPIISQSRAIENKMFVISCNRTGEEHDANTDAHFRGESRVIDTDGNILIQASNETQLGIVDVDPTVSSDKNLGFSANYAELVEQVGHSINR